jgi:hypothetical protein
MRKFLLIKNFVVDLVFEKTPGDRRQASMWKKLDFNGKIIKAVIKNLVSL